MHKMRSGLATTVVLAALSAFFLLAGSAPSAATQVVPAGQTAGRTPVGAHGNIQVREHVACHNRSQAAPAPTSSGGGQSAAAPATRAALPTPSASDSVVAEATTPATAGATAVRGRAPPA